MPNHNPTIDDLLNAVEHDSTSSNTSSKNEPQTITLYIQNFDTSVTKPLYDVHPNHQLKELISVAHEWITVTSDKSPVFTNARTGKSTSNLSYTVAQFELKNGDTLVVNRNGCVA